MRSETLAASYAMLISLVVLSAAAAMQRRLMEMLNVETEALEYRHARVHFERGERVLAHRCDPATGTPVDEKTAKRVVCELGRFVLAENESWLKSKRGRSLTSMIG
jgi:hypothetical protein